MLRAALLTAYLTLAGAAPALAAVGHDNGQGTFGPASDKVVTDAGFIMIAGFPLLILILSLIQHALDQRKYRRLAAAKARRARADERGGW